MKSSNYIPRLINIGLYAIIAAIPLSFLLVAAKNEIILLKIKIPIVDIVIWLVFILWIFSVFASKGFRKVQLPPVPFFVFLFAAVFSMINTTYSLSSFKEIIQIIDYFFIGYILFTNNIKTPRQLRVIVYLLSGITAVIVLYGIYQYVALNGAAYLISSVFDNRNVLGGFLVIILPLFFGLVLIKSSLRLHVWYGAILISGLMIITSRPAIVCLSISLSLMLFIIMKNRKRWVFPVGILVIMLVAFISVPLKSTNEIKEAFFEPQDLEQYHAKVKKSGEMSYSHIFNQSNFRDYSLEFSSSVVTPGLIPNSYINNFFNAKKKDEMHGNISHIDQHFLEWQAALNMLEDYPFWGVGIGNYQENIGFYYHSMPKLNTMEPDSQNGYLITASTMGIAGLGAFLWLLIYFFRGVIHNWKKAKDPFLRSISAGLLGGLIAFSSYNVFSPLIYQATVMYFVLVLGLISIVGSLLEKEK